MISSRGICLGLAGALVALVAAAPPVSADEWRHHEWREREWRHEGWRGPGPLVFGLGAAAIAGAAGAALLAPPPPVVYPPPPVVYPPPPPVYPNTGYINGRPAYLASDGRWYYYPD